MTSQDSPQASPQPSMYDAVGGAEALRVAVDRFYERVTTDPVLAPYFVGVDMARLRRHQALFLAQVLGGPSDYDGRALADAHAGLGISGEHYDLVGAHLLSVLQELGVDAGIQVRVSEAIADLKDQVVGGQPAPDDPGAG